MVWVVCWAWLLSSYSASTNSQTPDPTTGNLVNFTGSPTATTGNWVNGVYTNTICFQAGDPGNCGPAPSVNRSGSINFSYGGVNLYQVVNIEQALKAAGSNLQVTGFNYGFRAKNGNGWDDGRQDYLNAYVQFYRPDGGVAALYGYGQYTNRKYDWTNFNFSETFANPSLATSYRSAQYGFIGRDNNYWAGNYGPEITNVSFNLKYRVDPCATDPTSSPACPGYAAAMSAKNPTTISTMAVTAAPAVETVVNTTTPIPTVITTAKTDTVAVRPPSKTVATALNLIARNQQQTQALQTSVTQAAMAEAASAASAAQQQAVAVAASAATMSQALSAATVQTQRQSTTPVAAPTTNQTTLAPPTASNSNANNDNKSVAASTAVQMPTPRASTPATTNATAVSTVANIDTQQFNIPSLQSYFSRSQPTLTQTIQDSPSIPSLPPQPYKSATTAPVATVIPITVTTTNTPVFSQSKEDYQQSTMISAYTQPQNTMFYAIAAAPVEQQQQPTVQAVSIARQAEIEQVNNTVGFMTNRTDPLNEVVEAKPIAATSNNTESAQTVKAGVSDNELAGGVDINKLATTPVGYSNYTSLMLKDGKMYEPKEIYRNQTPVDNARALRQLSTDRLHQQMIEQQYRR